MKVRKKINNNGSTLMLVVISVAFIGILGMIILSVTAAGTQMKLINKKTKVNFYTAETALNEIVTGIEQTTMDQMKKSFDSVLKNYLGTAQNERKDAFDTSVSKGLREYLIPGEGALAESEKSAILIKTLQNYLQKTKYDNTSHTGAQISSVDALNKIVVEYINKIEDDGSTKSDVYAGLKIKNLKITFTDKEDYQTTIQTDLIVKIPDFNMDNASSLANVGAQFNSYCLISNNAVDFNTDMSVIGSLYAGDSGYEEKGFQYEPGIHIKNSKTVSLLTNNIVTRSDLKVEGAGKLFVNSSSTDGANVWANNIITDSDVIYPVNNINTVIDIKGNCAVKNNLILNAARSKVTIAGGGGAKGEYYGFSNDTTYTGTPNEKSFDVNNSSAILVNGANSILDLSGLDKLVVAGHGFIKTKENYKDKEDYSDDHPPILTGESITSKANQLAYLLPAKYIKEEKHNPFIMHPRDEFPKVDMDALKKELGEYVSGIGYKKAVYHLPGATGSDTSFVCYYYLDFKSNEAASRYFRKYASTGNISKMGSVFNVDRLAVSGDESKVITNGNYMTYDSKNIDKIHAGSGMSAEGLSATKLNYYSMILFLQSGKVTTDPITFPDIFHSIIDTTELGSRTKETKNAWSTTISDVVLAKEKAGYNVLVVDNKGKDTVSVPFTKGLVVATGGVKIEKNFEGLVISEGRIEITAGNEISANDLMLSQIFAEGDPDLNKLFKDKVINNIDNSTASSVNGTSNEVPLSKIVSYENWIKN